MAERLTDDEIQRGLEGSEWRRDGDAIVRDLELEDFAAAMGFVERGGRGSPRPPTTIRTSSSTAGTSVRLTLSTHSADGLTQSDLDLARGIDGLSAALAPVPSGRRPDERRRLLPK